MDAPSLVITARAIADSLHHGRHPSTRRGASTEFYDFRPYVPGDPVRLLDWRALARSDRAYLRRFHHESQLTVTIVLDASASMGFASLRPGASGALVHKFRRAQELAAAIAMITVRQGDRVGLVISSPAQANGLVAPPAAGQASFRHVLEALERTEVDAGADAESGRRVLEAIERAGAMSPRGGLLVAITDALDEPGPLLDALARVRFSQGCNRDVSLIQVLAPDEVDLSGAGDALLIDPETGLRVSARGSQCARAYAAAIAKHIGSLRSGIARLHGRYALCMTHQAPLDALRQALAR